MEQNQDFEKPVSQAPSVANTNITSITQRQQQKKKQLQQPKKSEPEIVMDKNSEDYIQQKYALEKKKQEQQQKQVDKNKNKEKFKQQQKEKEEKKKLAELNKKRDQKKKYEKEQLKIKKLKKQGQERKQINFDIFDQNISRILQSLYKKSDITKFKGIQQLKDEISKQEDDFFPIFIDAWTIIYKLFTTTEHDRQLLEELNNIHLIIVQKGRDSLENNLDSIFFYWILQMNDYNQEIQLIASKSFETMFNDLESKKRVFLDNIENYLENVDSYIKRQAHMLMKENANINFQQAEEIQERVVCACVASFWMYWKYVKLTDDIQEQEDFLRNIKQLYYQNGKSDNIILEMMDNTRLRIKSTAIESVKNIMNIINITDLINEQNETTKQWIVKIFQQVDTKDLIVQQTIWKPTSILIQILKSCPKSLTSEILEDKQMEIKIFEMNRRCAAGVGQHFYSQLVIFLSLLPQSQFNTQQIDEQEVKQVFAFFTQFLKYLIAGLSNEQIKLFNNQLINSYFECVYYIIVKKIRVILKEKPEMKISMNQYLKDFVIAFVELFIENYDVNNSQDVLKKVPSQFTEFCKKMEPSNLQKENLIDFQYKFYELIKSSKQKLQMFKNLLLILTQIVKGINKSSSFFEVFEEIIQNTHKELVLDIQEMFKNDVQIFKDQRQTLKIMSSCNYYKYFTDTMGINCQILEDIITNQGAQTLENIYNIHQNIFSQIQIGCKISDIENFAFNLSKIVAQWKNLTKDQDLINKIYQNCVEELNSIQDNKSTNFLKLVYISHLSDSDLCQEYFVEYLSQKNRIDQDTYITQNLHDNSTCQTIQIFQNQLTTKIIQNTQIGQEIKPFVGYIINSLKTLDQQMKLSLVGLLKDKYIHFADQFLDTNQSDTERNQTYELLEIIIFIFIQAQLSVINETLFIRLAQIQYEQYLRKTKSKTQYIYTLIQNQQNIENLHLESNVVLLNSQLNQIFVQNDFRNFETLTTYLIDIMNYYKNDQDTVRILLSQIFQQKYFTQAIYLEQNWELIYLIFNQYSLKYDIKIYLTDLLKKKEYNWLIALILSFQGAQAIVNNLKLTKYFLLVNNQFIKPYLKQNINYNMEQSESNIIQFITYLRNVSQENSLVYANGTKKLLKQMIKDDLNSKSIQTLQKLLITPLIKEMFEEEINRELQQLIRTGILLKYFLPLFEAVDFSQQFEQTLQPFIISLLDYKELTEIQKLKLFVSIDLSMVYFEKNDALKDVIKTEVYSNKDLIKLLFSIINYESQINANYQISVLFDFINVMIQKNTIDVFEGYFQQIDTQYRQSWSYNQVPKQFSSNAMIYMLQFLRKTLSQIEKFPQDFQHYSINMFLNTCILKCNEFKQERNLDELATIIDENNALLIIEFAETIQRLTILVNQQFTVYEHLIYELVNCQFPSIQKSCFIILREFYLNFVPNCQYTTKIDQERDDFKELINLEVQKEELNLQNLLKYIDVQELIQNEQKQLNEQDEHKHEEEEIINPKIYSYILTWILFINKIKSLRSSENYDNLKRLLNDYLQINKFLYQNFLSIAFKWIEQINMQEFIISHEEIAQISPEWSDFLSQESLLKLLIQSLYIFISKFPYYLRRWLEYEADKKYKVLVESVIKQYISQALFLNEVQIIEVTQHEWQTEEFDIQVTKNTREVVAIYKKEDSKMEIKLKIPNAFPIQLIESKCEQGVKIDKMKIEKWMVMMKSLLANNNMSIKDCLVMWKDNLDRQFDGLEECPVCYYIIHSSTGQLPKLSCKTCSKKFHSICINKWFNEKNKAECPMCKSQFL